MNLGKVKLENAIICPNVITASKSYDGSYVTFFVGEDYYQYKVCDLSVAQKVLDKVWHILINDGYCDMGRFNQDGDYVNGL